MHDILVNIAPHLTKSRPISHLVDIDPTRHISRSHKTQFYDAIASPKGFSPVLLLTDIISTAVAKHMHKDLLMQVCIEQQESGDREDSVRATPPQHDGKGQSIALHAAMKISHVLQSYQPVEPALPVDARPASAA